MSTTAEAPSAGLALPKLTLKRTASYAVSEYGMDLGSFTLTDCCSLATTSCCPSIPYNSCVTNTTFDS